MHGLAEIVLVKILVSVASFLTSAHARAPKNTPLNENPDTWIPADRNVQIHKRMGDNKCQMLPKARQQTLNTGEKCNDNRRCDSHPGAMEQGCVGKQQHAPNASVSTGFSTGTSAGVGTGDSTDGKTRNAEQLLPSGARPCGTALPLRN